MKTIEVDMLNQSIKVKRATLYKEECIEVISKQPIENCGNRFTTELFSIWKDELDETYYFENGLTELLLSNLKKDDALKLLIKGLKYLGVMVA